MRPAPSSPPSKRPSPSASRMRNERLEHFQEKWNPVFRPKMRQCKNARAVSASGLCETALMIEMEVHVGGSLHPFGVHAVGIATQHEPGQQPGAVLAVPDLLGRRALLREFRD